MRAPRVAQYHSFNANVQMYTLPGWAHHQRIALAEKMLSLIWSWWLDFLQWLVTLHFDSSIVRVSLYCCNGYARRYLRPPIFVFAGQSIDSPSLASAPYTGALASAHPARPALSKREMMIVEVCTVDFVHAWCYSNNKCECGILSSHPVECDHGDKASSVLVYCVLLGIPGKYLLYLFPCKFPRSSSASMPIVTLSASFEIIMSIYYICFSISWKWACSDILICSLLMHAIIS